MAKVGPNAVNLAIAEMIGQLLTFTTHPNEGALTPMKDGTNFLRAFLIHFPLLSFAF